MKTHHLIICILSLTLMSCGGSGSKGEGEQKKDRSFITRKAACGDNAFEFYENRTDAFKATFVIGSQCEQSEENEIYFLKDGKSSESHSFGARDSFDVDVPKGAKIMIKCGGIAPETNSGCTCTMYSERSPW